MCQGGGPSPPHQFHQHRCWHHHSPAAKVRLHALCSMLPVEAREGTLSPVEASVCARDRLDARPRRSIHLPGQRQHPADHPGLVLAEASDTREWRQALRKRGQAVAAEWAAWVLLQPRLDALTVEERAATMRGARQCHSIVLNAEVADAALMIERHHLLALRVQPPPSVIADLPAISCAGVNIPSHAPNAACAPLPADLRRTGSGPHASRGPVRLGILHRREPRQPRLAPAGRKTERALRAVAVALPVRPPPVEAAAGAAR